MNVSVYFDTEEDPVKSIDPIPADAIPLHLTKNDFVIIGEGLLDCFCNCSTIWFSVHQTFQVPGTQAPVASSRVKSANKAGSDSTMYLPISPST